MSRLLVTGGAGFIGANFVLHWLPVHPDDRVVVLDALTYAGNRANLDSMRGHPQLRFVHGDIRDTRLVDELLREERVDTIVHCAAESHVDRSIQGPDAFIETNIVGTHVLLKAARRCWLEDCTVPVHRFHHVSTDEVYGSLGPLDPAFTEDSRYAPNSPYSASKAASDHLVRAYHQSYGLSATISHCSNNYGPLQFPEKLIPLAITRILEGEPIPIYGDGCQVRDWLHVSDHCRGIELILQRGTSGEVYDIGGNCERRNIDLVRALCAAADAHFAADPMLRERYPRSPGATGACSEKLIQFVADRPGHDRRYAINGSKMQRTLGFAPRVALEQGLAEAVKWHITQRSSGEEGLRDLGRAVGRAQGKMLPQAIPGGDRQMQA